MTEISVRNALATGRSQVVFPALASLFLVVICIPVLMFISPEPLITGLCLLPFAVLIPAIIHCRKITQWKIWAFENVRNVHELKRKAEREGIILPWLEKFVRRSRDEQLKLDRLRLKFDQPDVFPQDATFPERQEVFYSKKYSSVKAPLIFSDEGIELNSVFVHKSRVINITVGLNRRIPQLSVEVAGDWAGVSINIADLEYPAEKLAGISEAFQRRWKGDEKNETEKVPAKGTERYLRN
jgi:hypothetical protein